MQFLKILLNKWYWWILVRNCCIYVIYNRIINCQFAEFLPILLLILIRIYTICRISSSVQYYGLYVGGQGNTKLINKLVCLESRDLITQVKNTRTHVEEQHQVYLRPREAGEQYKDPLLGHLRLQGAGVWPRLNRVVSIWKLTFFGIHFEQVIDRNRTINQYHNDMYWDLSLPL